MLAPDINKGLRNDFREAMEQVDQDYLDDILKQQQVFDHSNVRDWKLPVGTRMYQYVYVPI